MADTTAWFPASRCRRSTRCVGEFDQGVGCGAASGSFACLATAGSATIPPPVPPTPTPPPTLPTLPGFVLTAATSGSVPRIKPDGRRLHDSRPQGLPTSRWSSQTGGLDGNLPGGGLVPPPGPTAAPLHSGRQPRTAFSRHCRGIRPCPPHRHAQPSSAFVRPHRASPRSQLTAADPQALGVGEPNTPAFGSTVLRGQPPVLVGNGTLA